MKHSTRKVFAAVVFFFFISVAVIAQTNVSGGVYANTTWTKVNSPYIVTADVVVFPGYTLTIEPGVVIKFDANKKLEIRQAKLIAEGTSTDSITFTSNSGSPTPGIWNGIYLTDTATSKKFSYCNFRYASSALRDEMCCSSDTFTIKNSNFSFNNVGISGQGFSNAIIDTSNFSYNLTYGVMDFSGVVFNNCNFSYNQVGLDGRATRMNNCLIEFNQTGLEIDYGYNVISDCKVSNNQSGIILNSSGDDIIQRTNVDSNTVVGIEIRFPHKADILNCQMKYNAIGLHFEFSGAGNYNVIRGNIIENNTIGVRLASRIDSVFDCNRICNNTSYDLDYTGVGNISVPNNYWCTTDSATIAAKIYDGYDNISLGLVNVFPVDTGLCNLGTPTSFVPIQTTTFSIFPNPASGYVTVESPANISAIKIFNVLGEIELAASQTTSIDVSALAAGVHILEVTAGGSIRREKFIKQ